ncbi:MAG: tryptophan-rich sensory protein [Cyanobacteria bacterium J06643_4]
MLKSWMVIGGVALAIALLANVIRPQDVKWFRRLKRPDWLTFEKLIPVIWTTVFVCGGWSAYIVWEQTQSWAWMAGYILLELVTIAFTPVLFWSHSLKAASVVGAAGFVICVLLTVGVAGVAVWAAVLLIPYWLWSPIGTYTTWEMSKLNSSAP